MKTNNKTKEKQNNTIYKAKNVQRLRETTKTSKQSESAKSNALAVILEVNVHADVILPHALQGRGPQLPVFQPPNNIGMVNTPQQLHGPAPLLMPPSRDTAALMLPLPTPVQTPNEAKVINVQNNTGENTTGKTVKRSLPMATMLLKTPKLQR